MGKVHCGYRYFFCESCKQTWKEKCRDAESLSNSLCPLTEGATPFTLCEARLAGGTSPTTYDLQPTWKTDAGGNLVEPNDYIGSEPWDFEANTL